MSALDIYVGNYITPQKEFLDDIAKKAVMNPSPTTVIDPSKVVAEIQSSEKDIDLINTCYLIEEKWEIVEEAMRTILSGEIIDHNFEVEMLSNSTDATL
jgi:hypothetical protein